MHIQIIHVAVVDFNCGICAMYDNSVYRNAIHVRIMHEGCYDCKCEKCVQLDIIG